MRRLSFVCLLCMSFIALLACGYGLAMPNRSASSSRSHRNHAARHRAHRRHKSLHRRKAAVHRLMTAPAVRWGATTGTVKAAVASATGSLLLGNQALESWSDSDQAGQAEVYPFVAAASGTARSLSVYLTAANQATKVTVAIYSDSSGRAASLLSRGVTTSPVRGAWNTIPVSSASITSGQPYWLALLGTGGQIDYRDLSTTSCVSATSSQTRLTSLPATWMNGTWWGTCMVSAYVSGTPLASPATATPPSITVLPALSGTATQGQALSTDNGSWSGSPSSYAYQWRQCDSSGNNCTDISGATASSYTLASGDIGHTMRSVVTATNAGGTASATSAQTGTVTAPAPTAPSNTALPTVSGSAVQGQALNATNGSWNGNPTSYAYQWRQCDSSGNNCTDISGATASSYTLASGDIGHTIRSVVTATNAGGTASATSAQTGTVTAPSSAGTSCAGRAGSGTVSQASLDACGFPSMNTTGPPAGTQLTNSGGFTASTPGAVYNALNVSGGIYIAANNVTIQNSVVTEVNPDSAAIQVASGVTGVHINYTSIHGTNAVQSGSLAFAVSYFGSALNGVTLDHDNFYNGDRILAGYGTVTNSYCLGGAHFNTSSGSLEHDECIYTDGGAPGIRAIHDTLINANPDQTAAIFVDNPDFGGGGTNGTVDVENSILAGGDYEMYGGGGHSTAHNGPVTMINNRFSRLFFSTGGQFGPAAYFSSGATWSGNVWDDTNQAIAGP